jgi:hypothetical protein
VSQERPPERSTSFAAAARMTNGRADKIRAARFDVRENRRFLR